MSNNGRIIQLVDPSNNQDAATKRYVDTKFTTVPTPTSTNDAANKGYVDTSIPVGGIIMWSGTIASIPSNWKLCDGSNGTPNLTNRFIIGASIDTATTGTGGSNGLTRAHTNIEGSNLVTGGSKDAVLVSHNHDITDPGHTHGHISKGLGNYASGISQWDGNGPYLSNDISTTRATTGISINNRGDSATNKNLPPYYALAFIMRVS